jgi:hypothetical protein
MNVQACIVDNDMYTLKTLSFVESLYIYIKNTIGLITMYVTEKLGI